MTLFNSLIQLTAGLQKHLCFAVEMETLANENKTFFGATTVSV